MKALKKQCGGWKWINNYEGLYKITTTGVVLSCGGKSNHKKEIELKGSFDKDGYRRVTLQHNNKKTYHRVCRLVAKAFIKNPFKFPVVNHLDKNKQNDSVDNLEWTTAWGNWKHSEDAMPNPEKPILKLLISEEIVCEYPSLMEAARDNNVNQGNITNCLAGRCKTVGGFYWKAKYAK